MLKLNSRLRATPAKLFLTIALLGAVTLVSAIGVRWDTGGSAPSVLGAQTDAAAEPTFASAPATKVAPAKQYLVSFKPSKLKEKVAALKAGGAKVLKQNKKLGFAVVEFAGSFEKKFKGFKASPDYYLKVAEEGGEVPPTPTDPRFAEQWGLRAIEIEKVWSESVAADTAEKVIAVIDSGVCAAHPELAGRLVVGRDFVERDNVPQDDFGHGCAVTGVIAANVNNGEGIAGVTRSVKVMPLRVLDGQGVGTYSLLAEAIVYAADKGVDVINLSLGGSEDSSVLKAAVDYAVGKGVKVVAAAGNTGSSQVLYPAKYANVTAVGAVADKPEGAEAYPVASFSSTGSEIDVWAPGQNILTLSADGGYKFVNGTSFAAPMVSGVLSMGLTAKSPLIVETSSNTTEASNNSITAQGYDPGYLYNASNQDLLIVDDSTIQEVKPGDWYMRVGGTTQADDADAIWAKCSETDYRCGDVKDNNGNNISGYRLFKLSGGIPSSTYRVYNYDWNNDFKLALDENKGGPVSGWISGYDDELGPKPGNFKEYQLKTCGRFASEMGENCPVELPHTCERLAGSGVVIYKDSNCLNNSDKETFTKHTQSINLETDATLSRFNDKISSIKVTNGWSIKVFANYFDEKEPWSCFNGSRWDLNKDKFAFSNPNGVSVAGQITTFIVYNDTNCGGSLANSCPAPTTTATGLSAQSCSSPTPPPPSNFCRTITWGGAGNYCNGDQLVTCSSAKTVSNSVECRYGCQTNPLFTPDVCKSGEDAPEVSTESVKFYGDSDFGEGSLRLTLGTGKSDEPTNGTLYKSIRIPAGWSVKAFSENGQTGDQVCWNSEQPLLETSGWHNRIESVEVANFDFCPTQTPEPPYWQTNYYSGDSKWWDRDIPAETATCRYRIEGETLVKDFGDSSPCGGGHSGDNWVGEYIATRYFPTGKYVLNIEHDDGVQVFINGKQRVIRSSAGNGPVCDPFDFDGDVQLRVLHREESGDAKINFTWSDDLSVCNDVTPPEGTMTAPEKGLHTNGSAPVTLAAWAHDDDDTEQSTSGIDRVEFFAKSNVWNGGAWTMVGSDNTAPYEQAWNTTELPEGIYFLTAKVFDKQGNDSGLIGDENFWTYVTVDRSAPAAEIKNVGPAGAGFKFNVSWGGSDNLSLISELNYDVQYQKDCSGNWLDWVGFRSGTTKTFAGEPGTSYCFRARAIDLAGNVGSWSGTSAPLALEACAVNQFKAEYFANKDLSGEPALVECENAIDHDWGAGGPNLYTDEELYGDGGDGDLLVTGSQVDVPTDAVANGSAGGYALNARNVNFRAGQRILIYQVRGENAGTYQITKIKSYDNAAGVITTAAPLKINYNSGGAGGANAAQVLVIKQYRNLTVAAGASFKAKDWNGQTGGLLAFLASGKVQIDGTLDATAAGFRGGRSGANPNPLADNTVGEQGEGAAGNSSRRIQRNANGGGGGAPRDHNGEGNGGGGGANATGGNQGGRHISTSGQVGEGGAPVGNNSLNQMFFGGGGGGGGFGDAERTPVQDFGNGGDGGGAVFIRAKELLLNGTIRSLGQKGQAGDRDIGAAGSGAGGTVFIIGEDLNIGSNKIDARGISEGGTGTSGGGGQSGIGRARIEYYQAFAGNNSLAATGIAKASKTADDNFSVRWTGKFNLAPNRYKFHTFADDGMRVWTDGNLLIDDWADGNTERLATALVGEELNLKVEYYENGGNALARLNIIPGSNRPPVILEVPEQITTPSLQFADLDLSNYGYDPDFNFTTWSTEQNGTNVTAQLNGSVVKFTKTQGWVGSEVLRFRITDEWGEYSILEVKLTVLANTAPSLNSLDDQTTAEDTPFAEIDLQSLVVDPDAGDTHTFTVAGNTNLQVQITEQNRLSVTPKSNWHGEEQLTFTVKDRDGATAAISAKFIVTPVNDSPEIKSAPVTEALEDAAYIYQVNAKDVDGDTLAFTLLEAPSGLTMSATGKLTWTPRQADVGSHTVKLSVKDAEFTVEQSYTLTVINVNDAPVITSTPSKSAVDGQGYTYNVNATDEDGDSLTYSLSQAPAGMTINAQTGLVSWAPNTAAVGEHTITVRVSDGQASDSQTFKLTVKPKFAIDESIITRERKGTVNKQIEAGEQINIAIKLDNNTTEAIKMLKLSLASSSPFVNISDKNETIKDIAAGSTAQTQGDFIFTVDANTPVGTELVFTLTIENNQTKETYEREIKFTVTG